MKKIIAIILTLALTLSLAACGAKEPEIKNYTLDKDKLQESLFDVTVEGDRNAFDGVYSVTDETYKALVEDIVSKDMISDYIVFLPEDEWNSHMFFAFQTENPDGVNVAMTDYMNTVKEKLGLMDDQIGVFAESGWYVWSISLDNKAVLEVVKRGMEKSVMQDELLAIKESIPVFAMNIPSTLDEEFFVFDGMFDSMLDKSDLEDMYVLNSMIIGVNPLMIFKPAEGKADVVKEFVTAWQKQQLDTMSWYQPHLVPIIESMELVEENGYLIYIINEYPDVTKAAIASSWVEVEAE